ncbi:hypothetical protein JCM3766R1_006700 [Sporobolomyces carnicolor]
MDQDHFRSLLASSSSSSKSQGPTPNPRAKVESFGKPRPKPSTASSGKPTDFKPRPPSHKKPSAKGPYRDRAAERRAGKESDFANAEKLLEEFEARQQSERERHDERDRGTMDLDEQRKYLGGDAEHSILVKGLDLALLERRKLELARQDESESLDVEQLLDRQLDAAAEPDTVTPSRPLDKGKSKAKSRDDLLRELKASRAGVPPASTTLALEPAATTTATGLGRGWKKLGQAESRGSEDVKPAAKKLRKKRKVVAVDDPVVASAPDPSGSNPSSLAIQDPVETTDAREGSRAADAAEGGQGFGSDDDIFGDAGSYKGFDTDSDDDAAKKPGRDVKGKEPEQRQPQPQPSRDATGALDERTGAGAKRKYFDDDDDDEERDGSAITTAPSAVTKLASQVRAAASTAASGTSRDGIEQEGSDDDEPEVTTVTKLQPLSGARGPSVRELLEMDKAAEEEEKRKAKKLKWQQKKSGVEGDDDDDEGGSRRGKELNVADKANRDYLQMEAYLAKKKQG